MTRQINLQFTANTSQAKAEIASLQSALTQVANMPLQLKGGQLTQNIKEASLAAMELKTHLTNATNVQTGTLDFSKLNSSIQASGTSLSQYASKLLSIGPTGKQAFMQLANSVAQAEVPIRKSNAMLTSMMTTLKNTAKWQIASSAIHGFVGAISSAYHYAQDLDESLNNIRIVTEKSVADMQKFAKSANEAARALNTTTTAYTNASLIYYQQGLSDQEVKERTDVTVKMANVTRENATVVSDQLTAIWNNFDDGSQSLEYYADVITALGAATASSSSEISDGLEKFASVAKTVGLSYEYATAALATVTATTRQSADVVGTAFKTLFARLQDLKLGETLDDGTTLGSYSENLAKVGVNIQDASGQLKDMDVILDELAAKWDTLDKGQQVALAKGVAGIRQYNTFLSLMSNWDFMEENLQTVGASGGALKKQSEIYGESWEAASKRVKAAMESLYSSFMDPDFFIGLSKGIEKIVDVIDFLMDSLGGLSGVLTTIGVLLMKTFSDKIAVGIKNMAHNIYATSEYGRQQIQAQKSAEINNMATMMANARTGTGNVSIANTTASEQYSQQLTMQQQLIDNQNNMDQNQIADCQQILDLRRQISDEIIKAAEQEDIAAQNMRALYSDMLTQNAARDEGANVASLKKHKDALVDNINTQDALEQSIKELEQAYGALQSAQAKNDSVAEDERQDLTELEQAAARAEQQLQSLIQSSGRVKINGHDVQGLNMGDKTAQAMIDQAKAGSIAKDGAAGSMDEAMLEARAKATRQVSAAVNELTQQDGIAADTVTAYMDNVRASNSAQQQRNNLVDVADDLQEKYNDTLNRGKNQNGDWAKSITAGAQGVMSLASAVQIASGLIDTLTNPDATGWEKFFAVLSSGSMIIMMLMSAMNSFAMAREMWQKGTLKNAAATLLDMAATKLNTAAQKQNTRSKVENTIATDESGKENLEHAATEIADKVATDANSKSQKKDYLRQLWKGKKKPKTPKTGGGEKSIGKLGQAFKNFGSSFKSFIGAYGAGIGFITAGVAVAVGAIVWGIKQFNKYEDAAKEAAKRAEEAANAYKAVSEAYNTFTSNLDAYKSGQEGLKNLTAGTLEYREAVLKANEASMALLDQYKDLKYEIDKDGLIIIDESSLEEVKEKELDRLQEAQRTKHLAQIQAKDAQTKADSIKFQREELQSSEGTGTQIKNAAAATGAGALSGALIGAGIGALGGPIGAAVGAAIGGALGLITGVVGSSIAGAAAAEEQDALDRLAEVYAKEGNAKFATDEEFEKLLRTELKIDDEGLIRSLTENRDATLELVSEMANNKTESDNAHAQYIYEEKKDFMAGLGVSDDGAMAISKLFGSQYKKLIEQQYEDVYKDQFMGMTDADVQKAYAEAMGWATDTIDNQSGNKAKYYNKDGSEVGVISDEVARKYLAEQAAMKKLNISIEAVASKFDELARSQEEYDQALLKFVSQKTFSTMTGDEYNALKKQVGGEDGEVSEEEAKSYLTTEFGGEDGVLDIDDAKKYGYDSVEAFIEAFLNGLSNYEEDRANAISQFSSSTEKILTEHMSESSISGIKAAGPVIEKAVNELGTDAGVFLAKDIYGAAGDQVDLLSQTLNAVDWTNIDPQRLNAILSDAGLDIQYTEEQATELINIMSHGFVAAMDTVQNKLKVLSELEKTMQGDTITKEQYDVLSSEMQNYFTLMADGTYKLTQDALAFYRAIGEEREKTVDINIKSRIASILGGNWTSRLSKDQVTEQYKGSYNYDQYLSSTFAGTGLVVTNNEGQAQFDVSENWMYDQNSANFDEFAPAGYRGKDSGKTTLGSGMHVTSIDYVDDRYIQWDPGATADNQGRMPVQITTYNDDNQDGIIKTIPYYETEEAYRQNYNVSATDQQLISKKLEFLQYTEWGKGEGAGTLEDWNNALKNGTITIEQATEIQNTVTKHLGDYDKAVQSQEKALQELESLAYEKIRLQKTSKQREQAYNELMDQVGFNSTAGQKITNAYARAAQEYIYEEANENIDMDELDEYSQHLEEVLQLTEATADETARAIMKMNNGFEALSEGWQEWRSILRSVTAENRASVRITEQYQKAVNGTRKALSDLLDVSEEFISLSFIESAETLDLLEEAAAGSKEAVTQLGMSLAKSIAEAARSDLLKNNIDEFGERINDISDQINALDEAMGKLESVFSKADLSIGDKVDAGELFDTLQQIVTASEMTMEQANAFYRAIGFTPVYEEEDVPADQGSVTVKTIHGYRENLGKDADGNERYVIRENVTQEEIPIEKAKTTLPQLKIKTSDGKEVEASKLNSSHKVKQSTGKLKHLVYTGGGSLANSVNKGSGGGNKKKADKAKKSDTVERYKEVTDAIEDVQNAADKASQATEGLYGMARIKNMQKINSLLKQELGLLGKKRKEAIEYLALDRQALEAQAKESGVSLTFDADGDISNYTSEMTKLYNELDAAIEQANQDGGVDEDEQQKIDDIQKRIDDLKTAMEDYEATKEILLELDQEEIDKFNQELENNLEQINTKVELEIGFNEKDLEFIEYYLGKMESDVFQQAEAAALIVGKAYDGNSQGKLDIAKQNLQTYTAQYYELEKAFQAGEISSAQYVESMQALSSEMLDELRTIQELDTAVKEYYGNTIDMAKEEMAKYTDRMAHATTVLDHYNSILTSLGKQNDYKLMGTVLDAQAKVAKSTYDTSAAAFKMFREQADARKAEYEAAKNSNTITAEELSILEEQWLAAEAAAEEAQDQMLSDAATYAEQMRALLENSLGAYAQELEDALTLEFGSFANLSTEMERANSLQEEFLTTTNKIYETNKMMRNAQQEIDKTTNQMAKQKLKQFINETAAMQKQSRLSQYELDVQQAKYDLLLAEIALKEAQNAKSTVRLQRDSEGNFGYVYTADQNAIADAQQKFEDAQNALYNKGLEGANNYAQKYADTMSEMYDTLREIQQQYLDGEFASEIEYENAMTKAREYYYKKLEDYSNLYNVALSVDSEVFADSWSKEFGKMTESTEEWMKSVDGYISNVTNAFITYNDIIDDLESSALGDVTTEVGKIVTETEKIRDILINKGGVIDALDSELDAVNQVTQAYLAQRDALEEILQKSKAIAELALNNAKNTAYDEADVAPGSQVTVKSGITSWVTGDGKEDDNMGSVQGGHGYTVIRWDSGKQNVLISDGAGNYGWVSMNDLVGFDSGGYTGSWGSYGKMAMLHEKELVLNAQDTENLLTSIEFLHHILQMIDLQSMSSQLGGILTSPNMAHSNTGEIEQNVHIEASFPNVTSHSEIEEAFNNLINTSSQYAFRR